MSHKRVLLLHQDQLLGHLFRDKLEDANFAVALAHDGEAGLKLAGEGKPDAVVMDSALPGLAMGKLIPQLKALGGKEPLPVIVLPNARPIFAESAVEAGGVSLARGVNPISDIVEAIQVGLKMEKTTLLTKNLVFQAGDGWLKASLAAAPEVLAAARRALHEINREGQAAAAGQELYQRMHCFAEQMALLGQRPLHYLAAQIEALAYDLSTFPEQVNPSIVRTLSQSLDFLATLLPDAVRNQLKDPGAAEVLVVDDEDGARKIIMAAMRMANLKSMAADTPTTALSALGVQGFELIFLDVGLPEMSGFELCTKIRMLPQHEKTPIVFITGMATFQNRVQSSLSGGNDFVGKPFNISELGLKALIWVFKGQLGQV